MGRHETNPALARAIADMFREARSRGMSTQDIADHFGVSQPTINRWETGARGPALDLLPGLDQLIGQPRGHVLRVAGYVADEIDLQAAIANAPDLDDWARGILARTYQALRRD
jgi:transcriptional regulator with XRE-family HTH domain